MSSAAIYQNVVTASPFVVAIGLGAGAAFYLYFRYKGACEEKEHAREAAKAELNDIDYLIRKDIEALPVELRPAHAGVLKEVASAREEILRSMDAGDGKEVERLLTSLAERAFSVRRILGELDLSARETCILIEERHKQIVSILLSCREGDRRSLEEELAAALDVVEPPRRLELLEKLLLMVERAAKVRAVLGEGTAGMAEERYQALPVNEARDAAIAEIERFHLLLRGYDEAAYRELAPLASGARGEALPQRLVMIRDTVKVRYGRLKEAAAATAVYRGYLTGIVARLRALDGTDGLLERAELLVAQPVIAKDEYNRFAREAADHIAALREEELLLADMRERLIGLGYQVTDDEAGGLAHGRPVFFDTRWDEYKVLVRLGEGSELATRLVRVVGSEKERAEITSYQRQRDKEVAKNWCHDFDSFITGLEGKGYAFKSIMRMEPDEEDVVCIVAPGRALAGSRRAVLDAGAVKERTVD